MEEHMSPRKKIVIIMGSGADRTHCGKISGFLERAGIECVTRVASAHKAPPKVHEIITGYEKYCGVFITVAGRSNALSGFVDANTVRPVIACPPYGESFSGADIFSTLRMPSGVAPLVVLEPEAAALAAIKLLSLRDPGLEETIRAYHAAKREEIEDSDREVMEDGKR
jgi:5-(carboxyamino)imidazole ribonucleotide mutase